MIRVGVTGGIGSGKTEFVNELQRIGAHVLNADDFAKYLMVTDAELKEQLIQVFGAETYLTDGALNKDHLIEEAFKKGRVQELNQTVHPILRQRTKSYADDLESKGEKVFVYEAAVLLNEGRPDGFDVVVMLLSDKNRRVKRVVERDETSEEAILDRIDAQPDFEKITDLADVIVHNDGSLDELKEKTNSLYSDWVNI